MGLQNRDYYREKLNEIEKGGKLKKSNLIFIILIIIVILGLILSLIPIR